MYDVVDLVCEIFLKFMGIMMCKEMKWFDIYEWDLMNIINRIIVEDSEENICENFCEIF